MIDRYVKIASFCDVTPVRTHATLNEKKNCLQIGKTAQVCRQQGARGVSPAVRSPLHKFRVPPCLLKLYVRARSRETESETERDRERERQREREISVC